MSGSRSARVALACVCLALLTSCAAGGGGRRGSSSGFPTRAEVDALTRGSGAVNPFARPLVDADDWAYTEPLVEQLRDETYVDPSPWGKLLREYTAGDPAQLHTTRSMHCAARELARFYLKHAAMPAPGLRSAILEHCGSLSAETLPQYVYGPAPAEVSEDRLHYDWQVNVRQVLNLPTKPGPRDLGIAFARDEKKAVVVVLSGLRRVQLEPVSRVVGGDGQLSLRGRVLVPADYLHAFVNQGRYGWAACTADAGVRLPDFAYTCPLAAGDAAARVRLSAHRKERIMGDGLLAVEALRDASPRGYRRVSYTGEAEVDDASELPQRLLALVNEVRRQAGADAVRLSDAQSATATRLAPLYFSALSDPSKADAAEAITLGLLAGWDVGAPIRDAGFAFGAVGPTRDASQWLSSVLADPGGRAALLEPRVRVVAFGVLMADSPPVIGSVFTSYALFDGSDHADVKQKLIERIRAERALRGLPAPIPVRTLDGDAAALGSRINAGETTPVDALGELLQTSAEVLSRPVSGMVFEFLELEQIALPEELLGAKQLELSISVTHYQPAGEPWGRYVVFVVVPGEGTRA